MFGKFLLKSLLDEDKDEPVNHRYEKNDTASYCVEKVQKNEIKSHAIKITDLKRTKKLTIDKINKKLNFAKDNIVGIDIDENLNFAIVRFNSLQSKLRHCSS
jgi:hypothetical protein